MLCEASSINILLLTWQKDSYDWNYALCRNTLVIETIDEKTNYPNRGSADYFAVQEIVE